jgi:hypothetical protein
MTIRARLGSKAKRFDRRSGRLSLDLPSVVQA